MTKVIFKDAPVRLHFLGLSFLLLALVAASCQKDTVEPTPPPVETNYTASDVAGTYTVTSSVWTGAAGTQVGNIWTWTVVTQDSLSDGRIKYYLSNKGKLTAAPQPLTSGSSLVVSFNGNYTSNTISGSYTITDGIGGSTGDVVMKK